MRAVELRISLIYLNLLEISKDAAALRLHCGCILELRMHYLHFSAAKF
jgi:hypothetical protein